MEVKDVDTNQSLNSENTIQQNLITYGQNMSEKDVLTLALGRITHDQQNLQENIICYRQQLQQTLENITRSRNYIYQSHNAIQKFRECTEGYRQSKENPVLSNFQSDPSYNFHRRFIEGAQDKVDALISKIQAWRNKKMLINKIKVRTLRINGLIKKKYNMKNYLQQMELVKGMLVRVGSRLSSGDFDHRFLQQLMSKQLIPYNFYHNYCYNIVFHIISTRIQEKSLIVFKQTEHLPELFNHMKNFFSRNIYENCQQFIRFMKNIRIISQDDLCIDDGFAHLFKPFFLRILEENQEIQSISFLKARSLMQYNDFTIDTWKQYEQLLLERYILWNYEQQNNLRQNQLIRLAQLKQSIAYYKKNYQWIIYSGLKSNKIHGSHDFPSEFLKAFLIKILKPIMTQLYFASFPEQKIKSYQKYKRQFQDYWCYCIFGKHPNVYRFVGTQIRSHLTSKLVKTKSITFEQDEINIDQYYKYYQQIEEILTQQLQNPNIGRQFKNLWHQCWLKMCVTNQKNIKGQFDEDFDHINHITTLQSQLDHCITNKKAYRKDERPDIIYGLLMNLNFNSSQYFLLRDGLKCLGKSVQKEINMIRQVAYRQLYG